MKLISKLKTQNPPNFNKTLRFCYEFERFDQFQAKNVSKFHQFQFNLAQTFQFIKNLINQT